MGSLVNGADGGGERGTILTAELTSACPTEVTISRVSTA